jgi:hypothetical protein
MGADSPGAPCARLGEVAGRRGVMANADPKKGCGVEDGAVVTDLCRGRGCEAGVTDAGGAKQMCVRGSCWEDGGGAGGRGGSNLWAALTSAEIYGGYAAVAGR